MQQIRLDKEPCLAAAGAAHHQHVFVPGVLGVRWAVGHHQVFRFGEDDVVLKFRSHERFDIFRPAPPGRAVLHAVTVLLGVFAFQVHRQPHPCTAAQTNEQVKRMQAGLRIGKCSRERIHQRYDFIAQFLAHSQPPCLAQIGCQQANYHIGQIERQQLREFLFAHRPRSSCLCRTLSGRFATDCARSCSFASTEGRLVLSSTDAEYSLKAAFNASVSCALK